MFVVGLCIGTPVLLRVKAGRDAWENPLLWITFYAQGQHIAFMPWQYRHLTRAATLGIPFLYRHFWPASGRPVVKNVFYLKSFNFVVPEPCSIYKVDELLPVGRLKFARTDRWLTRSRDIFPL